MKVYKVYISVKPRSWGEYCADVVTDKDYHEGGPHAYTYRSPDCMTPDEAESDAASWAAQNGYTVTSVDDVANS
jgi:hypothetical protein